MYGRIKRLQSHDPKIRAAQSGTDGVHFLGQSLQMRVQTSKDDSLFAVCSVRQSRGLGGEGVGAYACRGVMISQLFTNG